MVIIISSNNWQFTLESIIIIIIIIIITFRQATLRMAADG